MMLDVLSVGLLLAGCFFFLAGTVGLLRFPDVYCRLHALTKADNLGLQLVVLGLVLRSDNPFTAGKLILIWGLALVASATIAHLVANLAQREGHSPWTR